jgi:hypothetical protein
MSRVDSLERLRQVMGVPRSVTPYKITETLQPEAIDFIGRSPFLFLATANADGRPDVSPKGDEPGFVRVEGPRQLLIPERPGNRLILGLQNILVNRRVALIFLVPGSEETLRVGGSAELLETPELLHALAARGKPALLAVRVAVDRCFFHCARAFKRSRLWEPSLWPPAQAFSFGKVMARNSGAGEELAQQIDAAVEAGYRDEL